MDTGKSATSGLGRPLVEAEVVFAAAGLGASGVLGTSWAVGVSGGV